MEITSKISNADLVNELNQRFNLNASLFKDGIALPEFGDSLFYKLGKDEELLTLISERLISVGELNLESNFIILIRDDSFNKIDFPRLKFITGNAIFGDCTLLSIIYVIEVGGHIINIGTSCINFPMLKKVGKDVRGNLSIPQITSIGGDAIFGVDSPESLPKLTTIGGSADFSKSKISKLPVLRSIGASVEFGDNAISLPELTYIGGDANLNGSKIQSLPKLQIVEGNTDFSNCKIKDLPELEYIGGDITLGNSIISQLPKLKKIGGSFMSELLRPSKLKELPELTDIGGSATLGGTCIEELPKLNNIGGEANFNDSGVESVPSLKTVGEDLNINASTVVSFPSLVSVGKLEICSRTSNYFESFPEPELRFPELQKVCGDLILVGQSEMKALPKLEKVAGDLVIHDCGIKQLPELVEVGGDITFSPKQFVAFPKLKLKEVCCLKFRIDNWEAREDNEDIGKAVNKQLAEVWHLPQSDTEN